MKTVSIIVALLFVSLMLKAQTSELLDRDYAPLLLKSTEDFNDLKLEVENSKLGLESYSRDNKGIKETLTFYKGKLWAITFGSNVTDASYQRMNGMFKLFTSRYGVHTEERKQTTGRGTSFLWFGKKTQLEFGCMNMLGDCDSLLIQISSKNYRPPIN